MCSDLLQREHTPVEVIVCESSSVCNRGLNSGFGHRRVIPERDLWSPPRGKEAEHCMTDGRRLEEPGQVLSRPSTV
jgi:hypothetical protein